MDRTRIQRQITYPIICLLCILLILILENNKKEESYKKTLQLEKTISHNTSSFTEGLIIHNNQLYESSGRYKKSYIEKIDLTSNSLTKNISLEKDIFAEGITIFNNKLYLLTYKEKKLFVLNQNTLEIEKTINYPKDGWGITHDKDYLITSDGSNTIYFWDENISLIKELKTSIDNINELEYINNKIWANIWKTNIIVIINPKNGRIEKKMNFDFIAKNHKMKNQDEVMNGIAYDENKKRIYLTGKNWEDIYVFQWK